MHHQSNTFPNFEHESNVLPGPIFSPACTILIVDSSGSNFILLERAINCLGISCEWKPSGYEIAEFINSLPRIDMILVDILLPYDDGFCALKEVRNSDRLPGIPIVAMAFNATNNQMIKARDTGFDGFLGLSLNSENLPNQICKILRGEIVWDINKSLGRETN
jgi:two-component system cell cycle response regulator DivK